MNEASTPKVPDGKNLPAGETRCNVNGIEVVGPAESTPSHNLGLAERFRSMLHRNQLRPGEAVPDYLIRRFGGSHFFVSSASKTLPDGAVEMTAAYDHVSRRGYQPWTKTEYREPASTADVARFAAQLEEVIADGNQEAFTTLAEKHGLDAALKAFASDVAAGEGPTGE